MIFTKVKLNQKIKKPVLALGSHTKNSICFARGKLAYISRVHPDLSSPKDFFGFEKDVKYFLKEKPKIIAFDLHPEYASSKYASTLHTTYYILPTGIQHHHAHIASCMAENGLNNEKVIGIAFDGTGLGADDRLWGAEFLVCDYKNFKRRAHLKEVPLLGGERSILEPWRLAAIWLYLAYKDRFLNLKMDFVKGIDKKKWQVLKNMYLSGFNSPSSSSMGRLFDAAASLVLAKHKAHFEAELAIELEKIAARYKGQAKAYQFKVTKCRDKYILDPQPMFRQVVLDLKAKTPKEKIAYRFHLTAAEMIKKACLILRREDKINKVVLSGGVFQNKLLSSLAQDLLSREGFKVFMHKKLSCNDAGISLGQVLIASQRS